MAEQIDSLFVRLRLETDQQQFQQAESMFSGLQSTILQFGATIAAAGPSCTSIRNNSDGGFTVGNVVNLC